MKLADVTPNLIVADIDRSVAFYRDVLGFSTVASVPDERPFVFVWLKRDDVNVFLNVVAAAAEDLPELSARAIGGTMAMFVIVEAANAQEGVDALFHSVREKAKVVMPLKDQFYGMREFAVEDPDGYVVTFAQRNG